MALRPESSVSCEFDEFGELVFACDRPGTVISRMPENLGIARVIRADPPTRQEGNLSGLGRGARLSQAGGPRQGSEVTMRRFWTEAERAQLRALYPHTKTEQLVAVLRRPLSGIYGMAYKLGLVKSEEYLASADACRLRRAGNVGAAYRFRKGDVPPNKGLRRPGWAPGRMRETQFKKGERSGVAARNWCPTGTVKPDVEGYLRIKVREALPGEKISGFGNPGIWPLLHRHSWSQAHGPIPAGHALVFKDGNRGNCALDNLELVARRELMRRNTIHNRYPEDVVKSIMLLGAVKRKLRERSAQEHDDGSAQPSV